jgi:hypothetical protein
MALNPAMLEELIAASVFAELQSQFLSEAPPEYQAETTDRHKKMAGAMAKCAKEIVTHITTFLEMPGTATVTTAVSTVVATAGSAVAQTGTGTGSGSGTAMAPPGAFK